jgi:CheY-specific phosphatase CheX
MNQAHMKDEDRTVLTSLLVQMCRDMFAANGEAFAEATGPVTPPDRENLLAACIGLSGSTVRGALVVVARPTFFTLTYPSELGVPRSDDDVADWAGEVANQLLGRIKNRLSTYGLDFTTSTPTVVRGDRLQLRIDENNTIRRPLIIRSEGVEIHFEIERDDDQALLANGATGTATPEGHAFLF